MNRSRTLLYLGGGLLVLVGLLSCSLINLPARNAAEIPVTLEAAVTECASGSETAGSCSPGEILPSAPPESPSLPATQAPTEPPVETPTQAPASPQAGGSTSCDEEICVFSGAFPLQRPISADRREEIDPSYRFGTSNKGKRDLHTGVEFLNPTGTPVLAAAKGDVVLRRG